MSELEQEKVMRQVQAMLNKAASSQFSAERDAFMAKAQELMTKHSLTTAAIERNTGKTTGKREEQKVKGGFYLWQRRLWRNVAELNFCMHWFQDSWVPNEKGRVLNWDYKDPHRVERGYWQKIHRLVGRQVNVAATIALCSHLQDSIERAVMEYVHHDKTQHLSSNANAFREGMTDVLVEKISKKFKRRLKEERERQNDPERPDSGFGTAVALLDTIEQEKAGNYDFLHGEGEYARKLAQEAEWAREDAKAEAAYTAWAAEHPEEAKKKEEERQAAARRFRGRSGGGTSVKYVDAHSYHKGRDAAAKVGLDQQVDKGQIVGRITHAKK